MGYLAEVMRIESRLILTKDPHWKIKLTGIIIHVLFYGIIIMYSY